MVRTGYRCWLQNSRLSEVALLGTQAGNFLSGVWPELTRATKSAREHRTDPNCGYIGVDIPADRVRRLAAFCFMEMAFDTKPTRYVLAILLRAVRFVPVVWLHLAVSCLPRGFVLDAVVSPSCWFMHACVSAVAAL